MHVCLMVPSALGVNLVKQAAVSRRAERLALEILEFRPAGSGHIVVLAKETPLSHICQSVSLIAPSALVVQPRNRSIRIGRGRGEAVCVVREPLLCDAVLVLNGIFWVFKCIIVEISVVVQRGVP